MAHLLLLSPLGGGLSMDRPKKEEGLRHLEEHYRQNLLHDIDNPLSILKCAIENIDRVFQKPLTERQEKVLDVAKKNIARLEREIHRLIAGPISHSALPLSPPKTLTPKEIVQNVLGNPRRSPTKEDPHS